MSVIVEKLSKKYGGLVYDFSKGNYWLYAHILSRSEKVENLINGISCSKANFLSVSPISYLGQKYYFAIEAFNENGISQRVFLREAHWLCKMNSNETDNTLFFIW